MKQEILLFFLLKKSSIFLVGQIEKLNHFPIIFVDRDEPFADGELIALLFGILASSRQFFLLREVNMIALFAVNILSLQHIMLNLPNSLDSHLQTFYKQLIAFTFMSYLLLYVYSAIVQNWRSTHTTLKMKQKERSCSCDLSLIC